MLVPEFEEFTLNTPASVYIYVCVCRQGEKFLTKPTTDVKLGTSGHWVGARTGVGVTATLV
jgi:hypothetical protein